MNKKLLPEVKHIVQQSAHPGECGQAHVLVI